MGIIDWLYNNKRIVKKRKVKLTRAITLRDKGYGWLTSVGFGLISAGFGYSLGCTVCSTMHACTMQHSSSYIRFLPAALPAAILGAALIIGTICNEIYNEIHSRLPNKTCSGILRYSNIKGSNKSADCSADLSHGKSFK